MLPDFLIVGAQKSGTTFVHYCLREHPDVFMPLGEIRFFEDPEYSQSDVSQLEALFSDASPQNVVGIKRPDYLTQPQCPERIHKHVPNAKLIVILRDPVERAISAYYHFMRTGFIPIRPVEEGMTSIINGEYKQIHPKSDEIIEYGFYYRHLMHYLNYFDRSQILIVLLDAIKTDPVGSMKQICRFIGVNEEHVHQLVTVKRRIHPAVYSLTRLRFHVIRDAAKYSYNNDRTNRFKKERTLLDRLIIRVVRELDRLLVARIFDSSKPKLSAHLKNRIYKIYEEEINTLESFLGQELTSWKLHSLELNES